MAPVLVVDRDASSGAWRVIGAVAGRGEAEALAARERILRAVPTDEPGATETDLVAVLGIDGRKVSGPLRELVAEGLVKRTGEGKPYRPYLYLRDAADNSPPNSPPGEGRVAFDNSPHPLRGGESKSDSPPTLPRGESSDDDGWDAEYLQSLIDTEAER
jgi:hypothetical protein